MRVAIDARSLDERNTSNRTYWSELVRALGRRTDVELSLISNVPIPPEEIPKNAEAVVVGAPGRLFSLATLPFLASRVNADLAHVQYTVSPLFRIPVVTMIHDVSFFVEPRWFSPKDRLLLGQTVPMACQRAAKVLTPSSSSRQEVLRYVHVAIEKVVSVHLAPSTELLETPPGEDRLQEIVQGQPYALLVGGASPRKNLAGAIEAVRIARETMPDLRLLVTGTLSGTPVEPWVLAPGPLEEPVLVAAYQRAHALLHPSFHEGFGFTVLEAMALGCPVVCSDRGSLPEVVEDAAILCGPQDAAGMAEGLRQLGDVGARRSYVEKGRTRAAAFSWDATAARTMRAYRQALD